MPWLCRVCFKPRDPDTIYAWVDRYLQAGFSQDWSKSHAASAGCLPEQAPAVR